ncbi:DUF5666 domain-containing protein [Nocardia sp. NPDC020380]|uniref:DUF5666 domain-containing protein n=1 Tax=Nocardia sp. NPDC020380 TaxID=3364309 RepID=UPI0037A2A39D
MTNPSDPWSRRPEGDPGDGPTEYFGQPLGQDPTRVMPPADAQWGAYEPSAGAGQGAGVEYPPTATYDSGAGYAGGAGYAPTQSFPSGGGYPPGGYPAAPGGPGGPGMPPGGGYVPAGFPQQPPPPQPPRKTGLWIGIGLGALVLVAVVGVLVGALLAHKDSSDSASSTSTSRTNLYPVPGYPGNTSVVPLPSGVPTIPGLGDLDQLGANMGTIASNDGKNIGLTTMAGKTVTVHTDDNTQVISLASSKVADLKVGDMVMVQGDKNPDGSIQAKVIISTAVPTR